MDIVFFNLSCDIIKILINKTNHMINKQTGFLYKFDPKDFIAGSNSPIVGREILSSGDWTPYLPTGEKQYKFATFDTMSCTTFSFLNAIETSVKFFRANNLLSAEHIATLNSLGFYADGNFNCSDRFTAIMSGTMPQGNYLQNVGDSVRKDGLLAEALLGFGGNNQSEYLDKSLISEDFKNMARKILDVLDISYEWTSVEDFQTQLKQCPIQGAIPEKATHAVMIPVYNKYFDSYEPYLKPLPVVKYAMKVIVKVKPATPKYKYFNTKTDPKMIGIKDELMKIVDTMRGECGFPFVITSGYRTPEYNATLKDSVSDSEHCTGEGIDLFCIDSSRRIKMIQSALKNGITRIGVGSNFLHFGISKDKPQNVMWTYGS